MYVRKHWYEVITVSDEIIKIYFERQPRRGRTDARWWLFSIREPDEGPSTAAKATLALNWALCCFHFLLISDPPLMV
jgi:hypothetical protein